MSKLHFTTKHANAATVQRNWYVVDGTNQTVGRMCARIAAVLRGKNKAYYTPHVDCGDFVIVTNVDKVKFTGNKLACCQKIDWGARCTKNYLCTLVTSIRTRHNNQKN
jgi:ribosomal protein L13